MIKYTLFAFSFLMLTITSCNDSVSPLDKDNSSQDENQVEEDENQEPEAVKVPMDFVPAEFAVFEKVFGDLNKDGQEDCILITKGTDPGEVVEDEFLGEMDRNRRGIIILFKDGNSYELALQNDDCFSSENEDGGVYFPPELSVDITKGNLYVRYSHGRYGHWKYTFRYQEDDFKLIGYDRDENQGPILHYSYSYNFLSGKKLTKENVNFYSENPEDEQLKETWDELEKSELISLSKIEDFDELYFD